MCERCEALEQVEQATNARELNEVLARLSASGVQIPRQVWAMVNIAANLEQAKQDEPDMSPDRKAEVFAATVSAVNPGSLDQEFAGYRDLAYELIDIGGNVVVTEIDTVKAMLKVSVKILEHTKNLGEMIGVLCALITEFGRQPELVAQIRAKNLELNIG